MRKLTKLLMITFLMIASFSSVKADATQNNSTFTNPEFIDLLDQIIEAETLYGLSGAQLAVYKDGELVKNSAYGYTNNYYNVYDQFGNSILDEAKALPISERNKVKTDTLFDMASNTKMYATVFAMQKLVSENKVSLDDYIKDIFPEFMDDDFSNTNNWKNVITVRQVLNHTAGFAPDPQYHNESYDEDDGIKNGVNDLYSQDKETTFNMVMKTPITSEPGSKWAYSDVDMMLAGFIVEKISGEDLDVYVKKNITDPLNLDRIVFNPKANGFVDNDTSSSEVHGNTRDGRIIFNNVRREVVTGEVHDEKAFYSMGGVSGHAGLFGTAQQTAYLAQAMYDGTLDGITLFDQDTIDKFTEVSSVLNTQTNGGWRRKNATTGAAGWFSKFAPEGTIGHTGWTGTNTFIDRDNKITLALFTNARNTPIMGPGANDFYTKNSNVSSYGAVSEFIYRGFGFGTETVDEVFEEMILSEINTDLKTVAKSKRNVVRSLIHVLEKRANEEVKSTSNTSAQNLLADARIQKAIADIKEFEAEDLKFLVPVKALDESIEYAKTLNEDLFTAETYNELSDAVIAAESLLEGSYLESDIEESVKTINDKIDNLVRRAHDKTILESKLNEALKIDSSKFTKESFKQLDTAMINAKRVYDNIDSTQQEVDAATTTLENAIKSLVENEVIEVPKEEDKKEDEKPTQPNTGLSSNGGVYVILILMSLFVLSRRVKFISK